jgi:hypothetical protein
MKKKGAGIKCHSKELLCCSLLLTDNSPVFLSKVRDSVQFVVIAVRTQKCAAST